jgi:hypothetical protein
MKKMKSIALRVFIVVNMLLLVTAEAWAQDPQFSQFYANSIYTNPAFAGSVNHGRIIMGVRNQWPSISGAFRTGTFSSDEHFVLSIMFKMKKGNQIILSTLYKLSGIFLESIKWQRFPLEIVCQFF